MFCAMDFSGNQESGNYKYLAVVACTAEFLNPIISGANLRNTVKSTASKKARRQDILAKLDAEKSGCLALCLKTDKASILSGIVRMAERQKKAPKSESLAYAYDNAVVEGIRGDLDQFLNRHGRSLGDVKIEADHDCKDLLRHANIRAVSAVRMNAGLAGFEPTTPGLKGRRATWLRHRPRPPSGARNLVL